MANKRRSNRRRAKVNAPHVSTSRARQERIDRITSTPSALIVTFTLKGEMECHAFRADSEEQQSELERRLELIRSGLDVLGAIWKQGSTGQRDE